MILSEHLVRCDTDGIDYKTPWYLWTVGRLQQIFMMVKISCNISSILLIMSNHKSVFSSQI